MYLFVLLSALTSSPIAPHPLPIWQPSKCSLSEWIHGYVILSVFCRCLLCWLDSSVDRYVFIAMLLFIVSILTFSSPGWCGSMDWALDGKPKGHWFDSQSGHMPGSWARFLVGSGKHTWTFLYLFLNLFLPPFSSPKIHEWIKQVEYKYAKKEQLVAFAG